MSAHYHVVDEAVTMGLDPLARVGQLSHSRPHPIPRWPPAASYEIFCAHLPKLHSPQEKWAPEWAKTGSPEMSKDGFNKTVAISGRPNGKNCSGIAGAGGTREPTKCPANALFLLQHKTNAACPAHSSQP
eukprot:3386985-Amphidinium_carterae.1